MAYTKNVHTELTEISMIPLLLLQEEARILKAHMHSCLETLEYIYIQKE